MDWKRTQFNHSDMSTNTIYTIVNRAAGAGRCKKRADSALQKLRAGGLDLEVAYTLAPGHASELAEHARLRGYRSFIAVGGDGTGFEVINGLFPKKETDEPLELGFLPLGTGNSFLRDFEIKDEKGAIEALLSGNRHSCDVVEVKHERGYLYYLNILSLGFSAQVGELTNRRFKALGIGGYALAVMTCLARLSPITCQFSLLGDGKTVTNDSMLLSFSNSRFTGGTMEMAPGALLDDGQVDVIQVKPLGRLELLRAFPSIYKGTHLQHGKINVLKAKEISFEQAHEFDVMVDGEITKITPKTLRVLPKAIEVMA